MADVVLVNPKYGETANVGGVCYSCPPLDLCYIAAVLEQNNFTARIFDSNTESQDITQYLLKEKPKIVGVTSSSPALPSAYNIIKKLNEKNKGIETILLGQHVTEDPEILLSTNMRYGLTGYCEQAFAGLCGHLLRGEGGLSSIDNLIQSIDGKIILNGKKASEFQKLPFPARRLLDAGKYKFHPISASRGCSYDCAYCRSSGPFYPRSTGRQARNPVDVVGEMKDAVKLGIRILDFVDDVFTCVNDYALELCRLMQDEKLKIQWTCSTRPDLITKEIVMEMKKAGCIQICVGVESGSERIRKNMGRDIPDSVIKKAFDACRKAGMRTRASALIGLPGESAAEILETLEFLKELRPAYVMLYPAILLPGSRLFELALKDGLIEKDVWARYMGGETPLPIYIPKGMSREEISTYLARGHRDFYLRFDYLANRMSKARGMSDIKEYLGFMHKLLSESQ